MTACFALYNAVLGWLRGTGEGQVMTQEGDYGSNVVHPWNCGVRGHRFFRWYHAIDGTKDAMFIGLGVWLALSFVYQCIVELIGVPLSWYNIQLVSYGHITETVWMTALAGAVIWLCYEPGHSFARYRRFDNNGQPEHVNFLDLVIKVPWYGWHANSGALVEHVGWYWRQALPFHAQVWIMTLVRLALVIGLLAINL